MGKNIKFIILITSAVIIIVLSLIVARQIYIFKTYSWERGVYSRYCYPIGEGNGNIKKKLYFKTLEECGKPIYVYTPRSCSLLSVDN